MKVKCIKTRTDVPNRKINHNVSEYIKIGDEFWVYGIEFNNETVEIYIFDDSQLVPVPLELFEIIDDHLPEIWRCRIGKSGEVSIFPELFFEEWFLDKFSDFEKKERDKFKEVQKIIEYEGTNN